MVRSSVNRPAALCANRRYNRNGGRLLEGLEEVAKNSPCIHLWKGCRLGGTQGAFRIIDPIVLSIITKATVIIVSTSIAQAYYCKRRGVEGLG
jgi:hypothetical protein